MSRTHDREFSDVIYKRLARLEEAGGSIDRRLAAYPEHGAELRPLLELAAALRRWPKPKQRQAAIAAGKRLQPTEKAEVRSSEGMQEETGTNQPVRRRVVCSV